MTSSLRIAFYTDACMIGGAEMSLGHLLAELDPAIDAIVTGTDASVVAWLAARRPGAQACLLPAVAGKADVRAFVAMTVAVAGLSAHIFHANLAVPASAQYGLAAATLIPRLRTIAVEQLPYPVSGRLQSWLKRSTSAGLSAHVAVGERAARQIESYVGLRPGSVRTIHNGVPDIVLHNLPRPTDGPVIGSIGRLDRQKGFDLLIATLPALPEAQLVLVGDGPERSALIAQAQRLGVRERVMITGWIENPRDHLTTFDLFALPSRFEGFPLALVEAMLAGVPVVAADVGSVPETVLDGRTGCLVPAEDTEALTSQLAGLLGDPSRRTALGRAGRNHAQRFTASAMARAYERLYTEVLR